MAFVSVWLGTGHLDLMTAYLTSPWSLACRALRGNNADFSGVNYATFWWQVAHGPIMATTAPSNQYHSEKEVWMMLNGQPGLRSIALPNWAIGQGTQIPRQTANAVMGAGTRIICVYTERQPCGSCSPFLNDALPDGTQVGWHFPWPSSETKKHKHDDDSIILNSLMAMSRSTTYESNAKEYQRTDRVEGNRGLGAAVKGIKTVLGVQHKLPWLVKK
ncbi:hypothetical protein VC273_19215 [Xanthomonas nasturtii]|uniref:hypothetical protein n=1 Tax=Xanthomonas TaxID=338 RepID=UPI000A94AA00|nr:MULTISPECIES: hypothetical protein [Xanthomonas]MEA9557943.1 hypothetical protein [Xanthomonas nasturtii]